MSERLPLVIANWKLNGNQDLITEMVNGLKDVDAGQVEYVLCPPFVYLASDTGHVQKGAQTISAEDSGAYTGEVAGTMLREVGCHYIIVGHSERRAMYGETDEIVAKKTLATLRAGLIPIICVGETEQQYDSGETLAVVTRQVRAVLDQLPSYSDSIVLAYEPRWAIGTGKVATVEQVEIVHGMLRQIVASYSHELAEKTRIIYGGSVKPENSKDLFDLEDVDGGLIGGASLVVDSFVDICKNAVA